MGLLWVAMIWFLNFAISSWNAYACGRVWVEAKVAGGWPRFMTWMGAIQSACGFSWCYLVLLVLVAHYNGVYWPMEVDGKTVWQVVQLPEQETQVSLQLGYLLIVPAILFSGLMITVDSWARAWRERTLSNFGTASYNAFAQVHNTYHAIQGFGEALGGVLEYFTKSESSSDSDDNKGALVFLVLALVLMAACAGILTATAIIRTVAGSQVARVPRTRQEYERVYGRPATA